MQGLIRPASKRAFRTTRKLIIILKTKPTHGTTQTFIPREGLVRGSLFLALQHVCSFHLVGSTATAFFRTITVKIISGSIQNLTLLGSHRFRVWFLSYYFFHLNLQYASVLIYWYSMINSLFYNVRRPLCRENIRYLRTALSSRNRIHSTCCRVNDDEYSKRILSAYSQPGSLLRHRGINGLLPGDYMRQFPALYIMASRTAISTNQCIFLTTGFNLVLSKARHCAGDSHSRVSPGGVTLPIMAIHLMPKLGFGWAIRTCSFLILVLLIFAN